MPAVEKSSVLPMTWLRKKNIPPSTPAAVSAPSPSTEYAIWLIVEQAASRLMSVWASVSSEPYTIVSRASAISGAPNGSKSAPSGMTRTRTMTYSARFA